MFAFCFLCGAAFKDRKKNPTKSRRDTKHLTRIIFAMENNSPYAFQLLEIAASKYSEFYLIIL